MNAPLTTTARDEAVPLRKPTLSSLPPGVTTSGAAGLDERSRENPTPQDAMRADLSLPVDKRVIEWLAQDQARWTRRFLLPWVRFFSCVTCALLLFAKRMVPIDFRWHSAIDVLCIWFVRRFCSPTVAYFLMRHFVIETNLMNFVSRNLSKNHSSGEEREDASEGTGSVEEFGLKPVTIPQLGDHAVMRHDINIYRFTIDLGRAAHAGAFDASSPAAPAPQALDFSDIHVPAVDPEVDRWRWLNLDLETSLYLMNIPFCLFTTYSEYERAVNSFQLDESLFTHLANLTGDDRFRPWTPLKFTPFLDFPWDIPRALYWHATIHEYAHGRLEQLARLQGKSRENTASDVEEASA